MKKLLLVLAMLSGSVVLATPAHAAEGGSSDVVTSAAPEPPPPSDEGPPLKEEPSTDSTKESANEGADDVGPPPVRDKDKDKDKDADTGSDQVPADPKPVPDDADEDSTPAEDGRPAPTEPSATDDEQSTVSPGATSPRAGSDAVAAAAPAKVWVCKYVGRPGVDERLKPGNNPISVSSSSTGGAVVGNYFADGQLRSFVVAIDNGGPAPSAASCPAGVALTQVTPVAPIVSAPTCSSDGALTLVTTPGVAYSVSPAFTGLPGVYTVTPTALGNYTLDPSVAVPFVVTVGSQLTDPVLCPVVPGPVQKVWVCKYVGQPGVNEVLKGGANPIEVSVNALPGNPVNVIPKIGQSFQDAQERSVVVALSPANPVPTRADCIQAIVPGPDVSAEPPTVRPASCTSDGALIMPTTSGVTYAQSPVLAGPGTFVVTATADPGFTMTGPTTFSVVVDARLVGAACAVPPQGGGGGGGGGGTDDPGEGSFDPPTDEIITVSDPTPSSPTTTALPDTGGLPLWYALIGIPLIMGGALLLGASRPRSDTPSDTSSGTAVAVTAGPLAPVLAWSRAVPLGAVLRVWPRSWSGPSRATEGGGTVVRC